MPAPTESEAATAAPVLSRARRETQRCACRSFEEEHGRCPLRGARRIASSCFSLSCNSMMNSYEVANRDTTLPSPLLLMQEIVNCTLDCNFVSGRGAAAPHEALHPLGGIATDEAVHR